MTSNSDNRLITVAIHTLDRARSLKQLLEQEGVEVTLQNVNLSTPIVCAGVRVRIHENDLPLALRIIENQEIFSDGAHNPQSTKHILVPVDFSNYSERAADIAFRLASRHGADIVLLHSYVDPDYRDRLQLAPAISYDLQSSDIDRRKLIAEEAQRQMDILCANILDKIKNGKVPAAKFSTVIEEGIPEENILQHAKENPPLMIVMGTRGADTKERELVGSVTAEVLDTCRFPVFTVPESVAVDTLNGMDSVIFFSNFDQEDILALEALFKLLPLENINVVLVKIPGKKSSTPASNDALNRLGEYCRNHYPAHKFSIDTLSTGKIDEDFVRILGQTEGKLIAVPNKKKNIFARLFNPGTAHRLLFHCDIPMIVIPV